MRVTLYDVAHARAGDKGNLNTIALIADDPAWYPSLCAAVTAEVVGAHLAERVRGPVVRHRMDNVAALVFVCPRASDDTVTTSLRVDTHGKSLSSALLELTVDIVPPAGAGESGAELPPARG